MGIVESLDASSDQTLSSSTYVYDFSNHASGRVKGDKWTLAIGDQSVEYTVVTTDEAISVVVAGLVSKWGGAGVTKVNYTITASSGNTITVQRSGSTDASVVSLNRYSTNTKTDQTAPKVITLKGLAASDDKVDQNDIWELQITTSTDSITQQVTIDDESTIDSVLSAFSTTDEDEDLKIRGFSDNHGLRIEDSSGEAITIILKVNEPEINNSTESEVQTVSLSGNVHSSVDWSLVSSNGSTYSYTSNSTNLIDVRNGLYDKFSGAAYLPYKSEVSSGVLYLTSVADTLFTDNSGVSFSSSHVVGARVSLDATEKYEYEIDTNNKLSIFDSNNAPNDTWNISGTVTSDGFSLDSTITGSSSAIDIAKAIKEKVNEDSPLNATVNGEIIKVNQENHLRIAFNKVTQNRQWFDDKPVVSAAALESLVSDDRKRWTLATINLKGGIQAGQEFNLNIDGEEANYSVGDNAGSYERTFERVALGLEQLVNGNDKIKPVLSSGNTALEINGSDKVPFFFKLTGAYEISDKGEVTPANVKGYFDIDKANLVKGFEEFESTNRIKNPEWRGRDDRSQFIDQVVNHTVSYTDKLKLQLLEWNDDIGEFGGWESLGELTQNYGESDSGSNQEDDPSVEYVFSAEGRYAVKVMADRKYDEKSNHGGLRPSSFKDGDSPLSSGQNYELFVSLQNHKSNPNQVSLNEDNNQFKKGGVNIGSITDYNPETGLYLVNISNLDEFKSLVVTDGFELFKPAIHGKLSNDDYELVLSADPGSEGLTINISPERTRTYNSDVAFDASKYFGERYEEQVLIATKSAVIKVYDVDAENWEVDLRINGNTAVDLFVGGDIDKLIAKINANASYTAEKSGSDILISSNDAFFVEKLTNSSTKSYVHEVELSGQAETGQVWSMSLGAVDNKRVIEYRIENSAGFNGVADQWIKNAEKDIYYAMSFNKPRLTNVAEAFYDLITTDSELSQIYEVHRHGRILEIQRKDKADLVIAVSPLSGSNGTIASSVVGYELFHQIKFNDNNWSSPQKVYVKAINDDFIDGTDALVFAPLEERVNSIQGPITVNGGFGNTKERFLNSPVIIPGESNDPLADGDIADFGVVTVGDKLRAYIDDVDANHINPATGLRPGFEPRMNNFPYTIEFLSGMAEGVEMEVLSVSEDILSISNATSKFQAKLTGLVSGLDYSYFVDLASINSTTSWKSVRYSFSPNLIDLVDDEVWTLNLGGEPFVVTYGGDINSRGRLVTEMAKQVDKDNRFKAEVRYGLRGEVDLLINKNGGLFTSSITRSSSASLSNIKQSGFISDSSGLDLTMFALFVNGVGAEGGDVTLQVVMGGVAEDYTVTLAKSGADSDEERISDLLTAMSGRLKGSASEFVLNPHISGTRVTFESLWPISESTGRLQNPFAGDFYYYAPYNPNFDVNEFDQVDVLNLYNSDSPSNDIGELTLDRIKGLGMSNGTVINGRVFEGGIGYIALEELNVNLGSGNDELTVNSTHSGITSISGGVGDDKFEVLKTDGDLYINGESGNDSTYLAKSFNGSIDGGGVLEKIRSHFTFNGGDNEDKLYLDDSNGIRSEVGIVTASTVNGFGGEDDNNSYGLRQVVSVDAVSGTYRISLLGEKTVPIAYDASEETFRNALDPILNPNNSDNAKPHTSNFRVVKFGNDYHIVMLGEHRDLEIRGIDIDDSSLNGKIDIERRGPGYGNEVAYYEVELMELYLGQGDDIVNIQGTSARTDIKSYNGDDSFYVSSLANVGITENEIEFIGDLDQIRGALNIDGGEGSQRFVISDAGSMVGDSNVSILGRVPTRGFDQTLSKGAFANAEMFIFGLAPAPVTLITDQLRGDFDRGLRIETGSGEDKVYADTIINRPRDNNNLELMTGLGDDEVLLSIGESSNAPVQINTHGDYSHRIKFRSGIDIAELTSSRDKVTVYLGGEFDASGQLIGGVALSEDQFRVLSDIDAIDLKLEGVAAPGSKVTAFVDKSKSGRFDFSNKRGERFAFSTIEKPNEFKISGVGETWTLRLVDSNNDELAYYSKIITASDTFSGLLNSAAVKISKVPDFAVSVESEYFEIIRSTGVNDDFGLIIESGAVINKLKSSLIAESEIRNIFKIDHVLQDNEILKVFSGETQLTEGVEYFVDERIANSTIKIAFSGRFNFYANPDLSWEIVKSLNETVYIDNVILSDDDFVNASGSDQNIDIRTGTGRDVVIGSLGNDTIRSGDGNDLIFGRGGNDLIYSDEADSTELNDDVIFGDDGIVKIQGVNSAAKITIDSRLFKVIDLPAGDFIYDSLESQQFESGSNDKIYSLVGNNVIIGGLGEDSIETGSGIDSIIGDRGKIEFNKMLPETLESMDTIDSANNGDTIKAGDGNNVVIGGLGNDSITTGTGDDVVVGDNGKVTMEYDSNQGVMVLKTAVNKEEEIKGDNTYSLGPGNNTQK